MAEENVAGAFAPHQPEHDAYWLAPAGTSVPTALTAIGAIGLTLPVALSQPVICFAAIEPGNLVSSVRKARAATGDNAYLVLVFPENQLPMSAVRAIDFGADDAIAEGDHFAAQMAFARGERVTQDRRRAMALSRAQDLECTYLQACIDNLPTPIFYKNERGIYVGCNRAFADYLGRATTDIIGHGVHEVARKEKAEVYEEADRALMASGGTQTYEHMVRHADGSVRHVVFQKAAMVDATGAARGIAGAMLDITERKKLEAQLADAAERDPLTNIYNRRKFFTVADKIVADCRHDHRPVSLVAIDVDHFKRVNDRHGHPAGDRVLCAIASLLERRIGEGNVVARAGGEEFVAILPGYTLAAASLLMDRLRAEIAALEITDGPLTLNVTVSIGIAELDLRGEQVWNCLRRADGALYEAKDSGRNCVSHAA